MDLLDRLLGHDRWTTIRLLELSRDLTDAQLDQEFDVGRRTLRATFHHIVYNVGFWTALMNGQPVPPDLKDDTIEAMLEHFALVADQLAEYSRRVHDEARLDDTFIDHHGIRQSRGATILQISLHAHGHRTEILHMLQRLGVKNLPDGDPQEWEHLTGKIQTAG